jgi:hypothetical protein
MEHDELHHPSRLNKISADIIDLKYIEAWARKLGLEEVWAAVAKRARES